MTILPARRTIGRAMGGDEDFWKVRELLVRTVPVAPFALNWDVRRWDGKRFYDAQGTWEPGWPDRVHLWETEEGRLVGAVNPEGPGDAHLQMDPDYRHLEDEMIAWAESHLARPLPEGSGRVLDIFVLEYDALRQRLLAERGYEKQTWGGVIRHMRLGAALLAAPAVAPGYTLRTTRPADPGECQAIADLLNAAFRRDFHNAAEYRMFTQLAPSFRPELDLVAVAPDDALAAYVGVPYDDANRRGIFEPVCTHPDHLRQGLAGALMREGLLRLRVLGAIDATVDTSDMVPANRLYDSMGFTEAYRGFTWRKTF